MVDGLFLEEDLKQIEERGMTPETVLSQLDGFKRGFPFARLDRPCTLGDGIVALKKDDIDRLTRLYSESALSGRAMKFVPASGAATRMFKLLLSFYNQDECLPEQGFGKEGIHIDNPDKKAFLRCMERLPAFAFYGDLSAVMAKAGFDIENLLAQGSYGTILEYLLTPQGTNLAQLPKGLIPFHLYPDGTRTPFEEHMVEAAATTKDRSGHVSLHFTVSQEHETSIREYINGIRDRYEQAGIQYDLTYSVQKPSTDTIAADRRNQPFRNGRGQLLFRPAGHGSLLENLCDTEGDIVFIKNIDNVVPDRLKPETYTYKNALGGYLIEMQNTIFTYLEWLSKGEIDEEKLHLMMEFVKNDLCMPLPQSMKGRSREEILHFFMETLNRPLRVCGMVKNLAEPGGGPFWVEHADGTITRQIVESSQVDRMSKEQRTIWESSTHFNPVDLVCGIRDYQGEPFDLKVFRDPDTAFISTKSFEGKELKALELPGLWNGAMAKWNTFFVEVPLITFNPVKNILDLLREQHRP